jgi:hypothetical protein
MKIVFTKNNSVFSKLIRWAFNEPVSHVVFVFDEKFVIHSNLLGVQFNWLKTYRKKNEFVFCKDIKLPLEKEEQVYQSLLENYDDRTYDYKAFLYFGYRAILFKLFKTPIPIHNKKNTSGFLCTEMYGTLPEWLVQKTDKDLSITTPYQLAKFMGVA